MLVEWGGGAGNKSRLLVWHLSVSQGLLGTPDSPLPPGNLPEGRKIPGEVCYPPSQCMG